MANRCLLYYITDRTQFGGDETERRRAMLAKIVEAARCGVDYIQLREKDLSTRELEEVAQGAMRMIREVRAVSSRLPATRLLINSRTDVALAVGADSVHLRSDDVSAACIRGLLAAVQRGSGAGPQGLQHKSSMDQNRAAKVVPSLKQHLEDSTINCGPSRFLIAVSCHTPLEVARAADEGADFAVFGPVFEKRSLPRVWPVGLDGLREACRVSIPVLALGGVTLENAASCLKAGARGIAGIRLFQESKIEEVVQTLRAL